MAFLIEVVVDRTVHGSELLECLHPPKSLHRSLSSSERLVGVFSPVVEPAARLLTTGTADLGAPEVAHLAELRRQPPILRRISRKIGAISAQPRGFERE